MARRMLGNLLHNGALIRGSLILPFFISFFILERSLNIYGLLKDFLAYFKKAPINPVHPSLNIAVQFINKSINLKFIFVKI